MTFVPFRFASSCLVAAFALAIASAGCSSSSSTSTVDSGKPPTADTGTVHDSGTTPDTGRTHDSGTTPDTGTVHDGGAGVDGGGATDGSTTDAPVPTGPITATANTWTWVPFPDAVCANGASTGIGVNLSSTPNARVLLYLEGGGACWSDFTCYTVMSASYITSGYGESDFVTESTDTTYLAQAGGFFDRTSSANPFQNYSYVYVPYCTGDVHGGNNVEQFSATTHFVGYKNFGAYLERLVPTFPSADRIILAGSSAGGFGAALNWQRTQEAFGSIRVDLIDDSGTAMPASVEAEGTPLSTLTTPWNLNANLPTGCTTCSTDLSTLYSYYDTLYPNQRATLLSYTEDTVLPTFFGITTAEFTTGLDDDLASYFQASDPLKSFIIGASGHVLFFSPQLATTGGVTLQTFLTQMVTDDASWTDVGP